MSNGKKTVNERLADAMGLTKVRQDATRDLHVIAAKHVEGFGGKSEHIGQWGASPETKQEIEKGAAALGKHQDPEFATSRLLLERTDAAVAHDKTKGGFENTGLLLKAVGKTDMDEYDPMGKHTDRLKAEKLDRELDPDPSRGLSRGL